MCDVSLVDRSSSNGDNWEEATNCVRMGTDWLGFTEAVCNKIGLLEEVEVTAMAGG